MGKRTHITRVYLKNGKTVYVRRDSGTHCPDGYIEYKHAEGHRIRLKCKDVALVGGNKGIAQRKKGTINKVVKRRPRGKIVKGEMVRFTKEKPEAPTRKRIFRKEQLPEYYRRGLTKKQYTKLVQMLANGASVEAIAKIIGKRYETVIRAIAPQPRAMNK